MVQRDLDSLVAGFVAWLARQRSAEITVDGVERPTDGWSSETVLVRARIDGHAEGFAVRLGPAGDGIFPTYDLSLQSRAQHLARERGVPTPFPAVVIEGVLDDAFLVMPLVDGHVPGEMPAFDPWIGTLSVNRQATLYEGVVDALIALHDQEPPPEADLPHRTVSDELTWWNDYLAWSADGDEPISALTRALAWCAEHRPTTEPPAGMLWGDVRLGNVVFTDDGAIAAVLDWEMATVGAPEHDLAWWWALEAMQDDLAGGRGAGFPTIAALQARYEAGSGRPLQDLTWFETFALLRSAAVLTRIGRLQQRAGVRLRMPLDDNPVLDHLARRIAVTT